MYETLYVSKLGNNIRLCSRNAFIIVGETGEIRAQISAAFFPRRMASRRSSERS